MHRTAFRRSPGEAQESGVRALVPVRPGPDAKRRLSAVLAPESRRELALAMFADVLDALASASTVASIVVTGTDAAARTLAEQRGAVWVAEPPGGAGLNAALAAALAVDAAQLGAASAQSPAGGDAASSLTVEAARAEPASAPTARATPTLIVMGDVPLIEAADIDALVRAMWQLAPAAVAVPSLDGTGTNALALADARLLAPAFGPESLARHRQAAAARDLRWAEITQARVALDIDTPADLLRLCATVRPDSATGRCIAGLGLRAELRRVSAEPAPA